LSLQETLYIPVRYESQEKKITHCTMKGYFLNSFNMDISLIAVDGHPSSSVSSLIFFKAASSPVGICFAL